MEENKQEIIENPESTEEVHRIRLTRHLWEDEATFRKQEQTISRLKLFMILFLIIGLLLGWLLGTAIPLAKNGPTLPTSTDEKLNTVFNIIENDWLFADDIENVDERLETQAIRGITTNDEDLHTSYMSKEEAEEFVQSINRNFVGIGVQYITYEHMNLITQVFRDTPAEKAGIKSGDIIMKVDGVDATGLDADEIKERVTGEKGTDVVISVERQGKDLDITVTRDEINAIAYGTSIDDVGYINLYQFGDTSAHEINRFLEEFKDDGISKLVIDLRGNGGGYITSLVDVASIFVEKGSVIIQEEEKNGDIEQHKATGTNYTSDFGPIVLLIDGDTASAAEAFTIAMKELRNDVTTIGTTTYGKGTVQVQHTFNDGSSLKYTTSKWLSPEGEWVNQVGIDPDIEVDYPAALLSTFQGGDEVEELKVDEVGEGIKDVQLCLDYLEYDIDRTDGYFSEKTLEVIKQFEKDYSLEETKTITSDVYKAIVSAVMKDWNTSFERDPQMQKALEKLNG